MDNWEIDDVTMMKMYDEFEQNRGKGISSGADLEVDFVPETQFEKEPLNEDSGTSRGEAAVD